MKIKKGENLIIKDYRKGTYEAAAFEDFDTEIDEWYKVITLQHVQGRTMDWEPGEEIPCRRGLAVVEKCEVKP